MSKSVFQTWGLSFTTSQYEPFTTSVKNAKEIAKVFKEGWS